MINERGWMASAGHDSTTARKSLLPSPWTADSELAGILLIAKTPIMRRGGGEVLYNI